jgi:sorbitol-specific phosphotransferase system component IIBC
MGYLEAAMLQNMPLLNRVLGTAALASVITALLMSHQFSRGSEPPMAKVIRLHAK